MADYCWGLILLKGGGFRRIDLRVHSRTSLYGIVKYSTVAYLRDMKNIQTFKIHGKDVAIIHKRGCGIMLIDVRTDCEINFPHMYIHVGDEDVEDIRWIGRQALERHLDGKNIKKIAAKNNWGVLSQLLEAS